MEIEAYFFPSIEKVYSRTAHAVMLKTHHPRHRKDDYSKSPNITTQNTITFFLTIQMIIVLTHQKITFVVIFYFETSWVFFSRLKLADLAVYTQRIF